MRLATVRLSASTLESPAHTAVLRVDSAPETFIPEQPISGALIPDVSTVDELLRRDSWQEYAEQAESNFSCSLKDLAPVIPHPGKIICVGLNYAKHILEMGRDLPEFPTLFVKYPEALTGPFDSIHIPAEAAHALDAEAELAVVIGTRAHRVTTEEAASHIAGYAIMNDYTLRDWQRRTPSFHQGKSFYRTAGFGPWLTTSDSWTPGPVITAVWGDTVMQDGTTDDLIFSCASLISFISQIYPLEPGDVIATGTPDGVGFARDPQVFIANGQNVTCAISGLGAISNTTWIDDEALTWKS